MKKKILHIHPIKHMARWNYLIKATMEHIVHSYHSELGRIKRMPKNLRSSCARKLQERLDDDIDIFIGVSIVRLLCYENQEKNHTMCREMHILGHCPSKFYMQYELATIPQIALHKEMKTFLKIYSVPLKDSDFNDSRFDESSTALNNTFRQARDTISGIINAKYSRYMDKKACIYIEKEYNKLLNIGISKLRGDETSRLATFKTALKHANMNFVIELDGKQIYPFVFDIIVMSFNLRMSASAYQEDFMKTSVLADTVLGVEYSYIENDDTTYYLYKELLRLIRGMPEEAKKIKYFCENIGNSYESIDDLEYIHPTTLILIKHYSEVLEVKCEKVLSVFHQLAFNKNHKRRRIENTCGLIKNLNLSFHKNSLREASLYVI